MAGQETNEGDRCGMPGGIQGTGSEVLHRVKGWPPVCGLVRIGKLGSPSVKVPLESVRREDRTSRPWP